MQDAPDHFQNTSRHPRVCNSSLRVKRGQWEICAAALCILAPALSAPASGPADRPAGETVVRLHPTAVVTADEVLLSDVAELTGDGSDLAAGWVVAAAPHPGASGAIDTDHVQSILHRRGVNLSTWVFRGSSRCTVTRPAVRTSSREMAALAVRNGQTTRKPVTPVSAATQPAALAASRRGDAMLDPRTLEGAIHAHIRGRLSDVDGALTVRFSPSVDRLLALSTDSYEFRIAGRGERSLGMVPLEVTVLEKGRVRQVVQVVCEAALHKSVVVAGRSINRGETIQADDLKTETRAFDRIEEVGAADTAPLIGGRARRLLKAGEQIAPRDVEAVPLVERNDLVTVSIRRGGLAITATARAMTAGSYGAQVTLRSELSKESFAGIVIGPKTVAVSEAGPAAVVAAVGGDK